jgi:predicted RNase H-like HicB family nuclease
MRQVIIHPGEDGFWVAECPSLPGCVSQGESREGAVTNIREAIEGYVRALEDDGLPLQHWLEQAGMMAGQWLGRKGSPIIARVIGFGSIELLNRHRKHNENRTGKRPWSRDRSYLRAPPG